MQELCVLLEPVGPIELHARVSGFFFLFCFVFAIASFELFHFQIIN